MTIRAALYSHLTGTLAITDTLSKATAVYYQGTYPNSPPAKYIGIQQISRVGTPHLGGDGGLAQKRFQLNCWADSSEDCDLITEALRKALNGFRGDFGFDASTVFANEIRLDDDNDEPLDPIDSSQQGKVGRRLDFLIWHQESLTPV